MHTVKVNLIADQEIEITRQNPDGGGYSVLEVDIYDLRSIIVDSHGRIVDFSIITRELIDSEPCGHPGCLSYVTHPCEGCGRVAGRAVE